MNRRYCMTLVLATVSLLAGGTLLAGGKIKVSLKDADGRVINGSVKAKKETAVKSCQTSAGTCTLGDLGEGSWSVSAYSPSGKAMAGPASAAVKDGKTVNLNLLVREVAPTSSALQSGEGSSRQGATSGNTGRNLAVGKVKCASGAIRDTEGRLLNGKILVKQGKKEIGYAKTAAGSYRVYDLEPGQYVFAFATESGIKASARVTIEKGKPKTINIKVAR